MPRHRDVKQESARSLKARRKRTRNALAKAVKPVRLVRFSFNSSTVAADYAEGLRILSAPGAYYGPEPVPKTLATLGDGSWLAQWLRTLAPAGR